MTAFNYRAVDASGRILNGQLAAANEAELDTRLLQIGLQLVTCNPLSKRQIEQYGVAEFVNRCKERVFHFAEVISEQIRERTA